MSRAPGEAYYAIIAAHRAQKDRFMRSHPGAPLPQSERNRFHGLGYWPIDAAWRVAARVTRLELPDERMVTSTGAVRLMRRIARLDFEKSGTALSLIGYGTRGRTDGLFIPFADATTGAGTYPGGRYLDVSGTLDDVIVLDFNLAYHPYCAYSDGFSCPIPPPENRLTIAVTAGERDRD